MLELMRRRQRSRLRGMLRGYSLLKRSNDLGLVRRIKGDLVDTRLDDPARGGSRFMLGAASSHSELAVRQYVLAWLGGARLYGALILSVGSRGSAVVYPLPRAWQEVLGEHGFVVARRRSSLLWVGCVAAFWAYGVLRVGRHVGEAFRRMMRPESRSATPYAYFDWLNMSHMPKPCEDGRSHDIVTWYARWAGRAKGIGLLGHGVRDAEATVVDGLQVRFVGSAIPDLGNPTNFIRYSVWAILAVFRSAFDALRGRWSHAFLLGEAAEAAKARLTEPNELARDYLFHNSRSFYRPLWTYEAEETGSRILFYCYAASEPFKLPTGYESERYAWGPMSWPHYLVWDKYQEDHFRGLVDYDPKIEVVGPIWFQTSAVELPEFPERSVAVFDVQPFRRSEHLSFATMDDLSPDTPRMQNQFLLDVEMALEEHGARMVHKRKRRIGRKIDPRYARLIQRLVEEENVIAIEPAVSPIRVIERCRAVISYPFTSPAFLARQQGKPSVYYDPLGVIQKDDRGAHGIEVVSGIEELREWVARVLVEEERESLPSSVD